MKTFRLVGQQSLSKPGTEPPLTIDGSIGPFAVAAVKAFQQERSLEADGKLTPDFDGDRTGTGRNNTTLYAERTHAGN
jgi:peptidoglycan hydrolase-like protein with peptidoglycan-binding domain